MLYKNCTPIFQNDQNLLTLSLTRQGSHDTIKVHEISVHLPLFHGPTAACLDFCAQFHRRGVFCCVRVRDSCKKKRKNILNNQSINQSIKQTNNQIINQSNEQVINQSIDRTTKQSIEQSINQSIEEPGNLEYYTGRLIDWMVILHGWQSQAKYEKRTRFPWTLTVVDGHISLIRVDFQIRFRLRVGVVDLDHLRREAFLPLRRNMWRIWRNGIFH